MDLIEIVERQARGLDVDIILLEKDISRLVTLPESPRALGTKVSDVSIALNELAQACVLKSIIDPQWALLGGRLLMENIYRTVPKTFLESTEALKDRLHPDYYSFVVKNAEVLDSYLAPERDFSHDLFSVTTLRTSYLSKTGESILETPQYLYLRVATFINYPDLERIRHTYERLSNGDYSHATPTLFNAGMKNPQMASCFLMNFGDSVEEIMDQAKDCAIISKNSGGLGVDISQIRHSEITGQGRSRGIVPWARMLNTVVDAVSQGGGKRGGSCTTYMRDCHVDISEFIELRDDGPDENRAKGLFLAIMVSDLFMRRVEEDGVWSLFCPNKNRKIFSTWGVDFETEYVMAENQKQYLKQIKARALWLNILNTQMKKGMPFILYIDACNRKSNQNHCGTITCSNLCTEILEYTAPDEIASCNLASISLNRCVIIEPGNPPRFDFAKLAAVTADITWNLNNIIDRNYYPEQIPQIKRSNLRHRPLGIGVQGLADAFAMMDIAWVDTLVPNPRQGFDTTPEGKLVASDAAKTLNKQIFECIYYSAIKASMELAKLRGPYESFKGSLASRGLLQPDLWAQEGKREVTKPLVYSEEEWSTLRRDVVVHGLHNSLLVALMPTATTAQILGNSECFEPFTAMIYTRTVKSGQFLQVNRHLVKDMQKLGLWNTETVKHIMTNKGSIRALPILDLKLKERLEQLKLKYLTAYEIPQKIIVDLGADRGEYIDQTQSFNCFMDTPSKTKLNAFHFYAWRKGLKTGMYYLRQNAVTSAINFSLGTVDVPLPSNTPRKVEAPKRGVDIERGRMECTDEVCTMCQA